MQNFIRGSRVGKELPFKLRHLDIPSCKPFRFVELIVVLLSFILLFFLRKYDRKDRDVVSPGVFVFFFTAIGSTLIVTFVDVILQLFKAPVSNNPMILSMSLSCLFCFTAAVTALSIDSMYENDENYTALSVLRIFSGFCFFSSLIYVLDMLVVIRYSCHSKSDLF